MGTGNRRSNDSKFGTLTLALVACVGLTFSTGCVKVAAYERGALAHPTMSAEDMASALDEHVRAVSEGATGGLGAAGGGCGCN